MPPAAYSRRHVLRLGVGLALGGIGLPSLLRTAAADASASAPPGTAQVRVVSHGDRSQRVLAMTVDDGWGPENVRRILATLEAEHVAATFMPYSNAMALDRPLWRKIADAGFPLGNHTRSHPVLTRLSPEAQFAEIDHGREVAEQISGYPTIRVFRPPYGAYDAHVEKAAQDAGFPTLLLWDTDDRDTEPHITRPQMLAAAKKGRNGSVLITHGGPALTPKILPAVIAFYRAKGFRFVTVPELLNGPGAGVVASPGASTAPTSSSTSAGPSSTPGAGASGTIDVPPEASRPLAAVPVPANSQSPAPQAAPAATPEDGPDVDLELALLSALGAGSAALVALAVRRSRDRSA